jgi:hypothetical protein
MQDQTITFPKQTDSPYKYIFNLLKSAENLIDYYDKGLIFDRDTNLLFITLLHLERSIDSYRVLLHPGSAAEFSEDKNSVEIDLNKLRSKIWEIRGKIETRDIENALDFAGEDFKLRFRKHN